MSEDQITKVFHQIGTIRCIKPVAGGYSLTITLKNCKTSLQSANAKLFVSYLSGKCTSMDLLKLFEPYGVVEDYFLANFPKNSPTKYAFVQFSSKQSAQNAIDGLNKCQIVNDQKPISVKLATDDEEGHREIFVGYLPKSLEDSDLLLLFEPFGKVTGAQVIVDRETREKRGFGFVQFENSAAAKAAVQAMNGKRLGSKLLQVILKLN